MLAIRVTNLVRWNLGVSLKLLSNLLCKAVIEASKRKVKSWEFTSHTDYRNLFVCGAGGRGAC